jgi:DNA-binding LacI/PurR family transcriptional regulator
MSYSSSQADSRQMKLPQVMESRGITRGAILVGATMTNLIALLQARDLPFAVMGNNVIGDWRPEEFDCVYFDGEQGAFELTTHLLALGHRNICFMANCQLPWFAQSSRGYLRAMTDAGLEPRIQELHTSERELGYLCTKSILARGEPVTAIFAGSDTIAQGAYRALGDADIHVPDQMSVAGFNDSEGAILDPPLTTARFFFEEMGAHLAEFVLSRAVDRHLPPRILTIPMRLIKRNSCAPVQAAKTQQQTETFDNARLTPR